MSSVAAMPQADRLLRTLRQKRTDGVTPVDFAAPDVIDGGSPIMRVAARVQDLRDRGHRIDTRKGRGRVARYVLIESPAGTKAARARPQTPPDRDVAEARAALAAAEALERQDAEAQDAADLAAHVAAGEPLHLFDLA